ncbi:hypothetical protein FRC06_004477 [Ceratobasidium sp. 370]|nr:hypothetical protein FRC06_004477 [Ceratobasidium sp. 370]
MASFPANTALPSIAHGGEHDDNTPTTSIAILKYSEASQRVLIDRFYAILALTSKVTIVCGAGISTHAGIPDFRSRNGLLNRTFGDRNQLKGSELFESSTLRNSEKRKALSQEMARMRVFSRTVSLTRCHTLITRLYDAKRLLRCYTQNIDGLQTRDRKDMEEAVFELHGTNLHLRCYTCNKRPAQPASDFDRQLLSNGYALCPSCLTNPARKIGNSRNLRCSQPGELLPDIVFNDQVTEPWKNGKTIDQLANKDSKCHLLLIIGTRLKPMGAAKLVKGLSDEVHRSGGKVVYVDWTGLPPSSWANYVDLHIQMDIEQWAEGCLNALGSAEAKKGKRWIAEQTSTLIDEARLQCAYECNSPVHAKQHEQSVSDREIIVPHKRKKVRFECGSETGGAAPEEEWDEVLPILFVVYHNIWATHEARILARLMAEECAVLGRECRPHVVKVGGKEGCIAPPADWPSFCLIVVHVSWYTQFLHSEVPPTSGEAEIAELLKYSSKLVDCVARQATWSTAVMMCEERP